jgi:regulator of protease activity HflC (stomatin/prohibitin superfamily)
LIKKNGLTFLFLIFLFSATLIVLWPHIVVSIPAGNVGVLFQLPFKGINTDRVLGPGLVIKFPWDTVTQYNGRIQKASTNLDILTEDLMKSNITINFQYEINTLTVPLLHQYVGPDYFEKIIKPEVISEVRASLGRFSSSDAFTKNVLGIQQDMSIDVDRVIFNNINPPGLEKIRLVRISGIQIESIKFPDEVEKAIENKLVESAKADSYKYILQGAAQEAQRKAIEAEGIRKFQDIVRPGLTDNYLRWKGIEATEKLAASENAKIVMFGQGSSGLPLIMGDFDRSSPSKGITQVQPASPAPAQRN